MIAHMNTDLPIRELVGKFYERVQEDDGLGPIFAQHLSGQWDEHLERMCAFWTKVLVGTGDFQGNVYGKHMALEGLEPEHFQQWLRLFRQTADEVFADKIDAQAAIAVAGRIAESLQMGYFIRHPAAGASAAE